MFVILDTETTGLDTCNIIQVAFYNAHGKSFNRNIKPTVRIAPAATIIHGITNEEASKFPDKSVVLKELEQYLQSLPADTIYAGYNIDFDLKCIAQDFQIKLNRTFDVLRLTKKYIPYSILGGYKLDAAYYYLFPDRLQKLFEERNSHNAMTDCILTQHVLDKLLEIAVQRGDLPENYTDSDVYQLVLNPILIDSWPFGKYRNQPLTIDPSYAAWYIRQKDVDADISYSIRTLLPNLK